MKFIFSKIVMLMLPLIFMTKAYAEAPSVVFPLPGAIHESMVTPLGDGALLEFQWTDNGTRHEDYAIHVGSSPAGIDIQRITHLGTRYFEERPEIQSLKIGIPANGETLYVRFLWFDEGEWHYDDIEYTAPIL